MPLRALIAEDEPILAQSLHAALKRLWPQLEIALAANGYEAVDVALAQRPDVLFLDIKMPGKSGLEAAQELAEEWPEGIPFPLVVFVTAYDEYALQAFEQAAADYVLKPATDARLASTVARLQERLAQRLPAGRTEEAGVEHDGELERLLAQLRALASANDAGAASSAQPARPRNEALQFIRAAVGNQVRLIPVAEVLYFQASDKYVSVVTAEGESLIRTSLKELLPQLDAAVFWQIHRATVVNSTRIKAAVRDEQGKLSVSLHGHDRLLSVSRVFAHLFRPM